MNRLKQHRDHRAFADCGYLPAQNSLASISTDPRMVGLTPVLQGEAPANWAVADIGR